MAVKRTQKGERRIAGICNAARVLKVSRQHLYYVLTHKRESKLLQERYAALLREQKDCKHKFVDSEHCLKCGWKPPTEVASRPSGGPEARLPMHHVHFPKAMPTIVVPFSGLTSPVQRECILIAVGAHEVGHRAVYRTLGWDASIVPVFDDAGELTNAVCYPIPPLDAKLVKPLERFQESVLGWAGVISEAICGVTLLRNVPALTGENISAWCNAIRFSCWNHFSSPDRECIDRWRRIEESASFAFRLLSHYRTLRSESRAVAAEFREARRKLMASKDIEIPEEERFAERQVEAV